MFTVQVTACNSAIGRYHLYDPECAKYCSSSQFSIVAHGRSLSDLEVLEYTKANSVAHSMSISLMLCAVVFGYFG